ncbi:MAG: hypothetical protein KIT22_01360 [Verrucomicrobiae bacterium]|nr:hypothetical protein [Verrucomicrobiae bacterium]
MNEDTTERLVQLTLAQELDFALARLPIRNERLELKSLFTEELLLALPPGHPLVRCRAVHAANLEDQRLIVMKEGHCLGDQVLAFCERQGARGGGSSPEYRPFRSPKRCREIVALWLRQRPPGWAAAVFLEQLAARFPSADRSAKP